MLYYLLMALYYIVNWIPKKMSYFFSDFVANLSCKLNRSSFAAIVSNMKAILGDNGSEAQAKEMAKELCRNFLRNKIDLLLFPKMKQKGSFHVSFEGIENLHKSLSKEKGAILLSAHLGPIEAIGSVLDKLGYSLNVIVRQNKNKNLNRFIQNLRRWTNPHIHLIQIGGANASSSVIGMECFNALKANQLLAVCGDRLHSDNGLMIDFFGKQTLLPMGPAFLSHIQKVDVIPCFILKVGDEQFRVIFKEPLTPAENKEKQEVIEDITTQYAKILEEIIRMAPTQWFVFEDLWEKDFPEKAGRARKALFGSEKYTNPLK